MNLGTKTNSWKIVLKYTEIHTVLLTGYLNKEIAFVKIRLSLNWHHVILSPFAAYRPSYKNIRTTLKSIVSKQEKC